MTKDYLEEWWNKELELPSMICAPRFSQLTEDDKHQLSCSSSYAYFVLDKQFTGLGKSILKFFGIKR